MSLFRRSPATCEVAGGVMASVRYWLKLHLWVGVVSWIAFGLKEVL